MIKFVGETLWYFIASVLITAMVLTYVNGNPLRYSCLENPMDGGTWWAAVHGVARSRIRLSDFTLFFPLSCIGEGNGNPPQYSCLENPMDGGTWQATVHGIAKSQTRLNNFTYFTSFSKIIYNTDLPPFLFRTGTPELSEVLSSGLWKSFCPR